MPSYLLKSKKELIDAISSWWVTLHGHSNEYIADAIFNQSKNLSKLYLLIFTSTGKKIGGKT